MEEKRKQRAERFKQGEAGGDACKFAGDCCWIQCCQIAACCQVQAALQAWWVCRQSIELTTVCSEGMFRARYRKVAW